MRELQDERASGQAVGKSQQGRGNGGWAQKAPIRAVLLPPKPFLLAALSADLFWLGADQPENASVILKRLQLTPERPILGMIWPDLPPKTQS